MKDELKEVIENHYSDVTLQEAMIKSKNEKIEMLEKEVKNFKHEKVENKKILESMEKKISELTSSIGDVESELKLITDHEECEPAKINGQSIDNKDNLSDDANEDQIDSFAFKNHLMKISSLIDKTLKGNHIEKEKLKNFVHWKKKIRRLQDCEKAKKTLDVWNLHDMLTSIVSLDKMWKEMLVCRDATKKEFKMMVECHDETLKILRTKRKKLKGND